MPRVLREGDTGEDVELWELFLVGQNYYWVEADGIFDEETKKCTEEWQKNHGLKPDGEVGPKTYGRAQTLGFNPEFEDESEDKSSLNWPPKPSFSPLNYADRNKVFGGFSYKPAGHKSNPEAITVLGNWVRENITYVEIPQLGKFVANKKVPFHTKCAEQIAHFFEDIEHNGLLHLIKTWGGSYAPRFVRGSRTYLSNHSYGSAFDINVQWNYLGTEPARVGAEGSVRELVPFAHKHGLYWGGHFKRKDGMHFEVAEVRG